MNSSTQADIKATYASLVSALAISENNANIAGIALETARQASRDACLAIDTQVRQELLSETFDQATVDNMKALQATRASAQSALTTALDTYETAIAALDSDRAALNAHVASTCCLDWAL